jgi:hypothetical protein
VAAVICATLVGYSGWFWHTTLFQVLAKGGRVTYSVKTKLLVSGRWIWIIYIDRQIKEVSSLDGYATEREALDASSEYLYDHVAYADGIPMPEE